MNNKYFEIIPKVNEINSYEEYKNFINELKKEKIILEKIIKDKIEKNKEYEESRKLTNKIGSEYIKLQDEEKTQREKLIKMIPSRF